MNKISLKNNLSRILDILFLLVPFIDFTYSFDFDLADIRLSYFIYVIYFIVNINLILKKEQIYNLLKNSKYLIMIFSFIILISIVNIYLNNDTIFLLLKQIVIISFVFFTTWLFFYKNKQNIYEIFKLYLNISVFVAIIGIFQELSYLLGFSYGYDFSYLKAKDQFSNAGIFLRNCSVAGEPSNLVYALSLAFYTSLVSFITKQEKPILNIVKSIIIILCFSLTFSLIGYIGIAISLILITIIYFKRIRIINLLILLLLFSALFYFGKNTFTSRIDGAITETQRAINPQETTNAKKKEKKKFTNQSSYSIILQAKISFTNFKEHFLFGTGLGSHLVAFNKYYERFHYDERQRILHKSDAASLFLRLVSELGLFGIILISFFLLRFNIFLPKYNSDLDYIVLINYGCLLFILLRLIRCGVYYADGFFLFSLLYYYSKKNYIKNKLNKENDSLISNT